MAKLDCQQCGGVMKKAAFSSGNFTGIIFALIVFFLGVWLLVTIPTGIDSTFRMVIGVLLIIVSLGMGGKRRKVWKCKNCGYVFDRA